MVAKVIGHVDGQSITRRSKQLHKHLHKCTCGHLKPYDWARETVMKREIVDAMSPQKRTSFFLKKDSDVFMAMCTECFNRLALDMYQVKADGMTYNNVKVIERKTRVFLDTGHGNRLEVKASNFKCVFYTVAETDPEHWKDVQEMRELAQQQKEEREAEEKRWYDGHKGYLSMDGYLAHVNTGNIAHVEGKKVTIYQDDLGKTSRKVLNKWLRKEHGIKSLDAKGVIVVRA